MILKQGKKIWPENLVLDFFYVILLFKNTFIFLAVIFLLKNEKKGFVYYKIKKYYSF